MGGPGELDWRIGVGDERTDDGGVRVCVRCGVEGWRGGGGRV